MEFNHTVLQINVLGKTMSTGRSVREMHDYLCEHGAKSYIACPQKNDSDDVFSFTSQNRMYLDYLFSLITGFEGIHSKFPTKKLIKYIEQIQPDIVHLRVLHCNSLDLCMLFKYLSKKKIAVVITLHDFWYMTGQCVYYTAVGCDKWKNGCGNCPNLSFQGRKPLFDRTAKIWKLKKSWFESIDNLAVIGVSKWVAEEARQSLLQNAKIIKPIYNWIDYQIFYPKDVRNLRNKLGMDGKKIILAVSTMWVENDRKGFKVYIELSKHIPPEYVIILLGKNNTPYTDSSNTYFIHQTNNVDELADYYSLADVYLNLSEEETFGKVSAEALSCGTPVVAYDSTANKELVPEGGGVVLKTRDIDEILVSLRNVLSKPKEQYAEICRSYVLKNFDKEHNIQEYLNVYKELIRNQGE